MGRRSVAGGRACPGAVLGVAGGPGLDGLGVGEGEGDIVEAFEEEAFAEGVDLEGDGGGCWGLRSVGWGGRW